MIQVPAILSGVSTRADGGVGVRITTNELTQDQKIELMELTNKFGWFLFKESDTGFTADEIPKFNPKALDLQKSPSERLRAVLWRVGEKRGLKTEGEQNAFYMSYMESIIEKIKDKLNDV